MRNRRLYYALRPVLRFMVLVHQAIPSPVCRGMLVALRHVPGMVGIGLRYILVARLSKLCGECVAIREGVYLHKLEHVCFGSHISVHPMCYIDGSGGLSIGNDVSIAHAASIMTSEHDFSVLGTMTRDAEMRFEPVQIESDVWIGCGVRVLAGVTIERGSVIGAGAVVTHNIRAQSIAVGVPARKIKSIEKQAA